MKSEDIKIFRFALKLTEPLVLRNATLAKREGLAVNIISDTGSAGWGEVSPLVGFSAESMDTAIEQLVYLKESMRGVDVPAGLEKLDGSFENWLKPFALSPSVRFGFESAILNVLSDSRQTPMRNLIADNPCGSIAINGLLFGTPEQVITRAGHLCREGFTTVKLKVGARTVTEDLALLAQVRETIGDKIELRLDANRAWSFEDAGAFMHRAAEFDIEYIEEPTRNLDQLRKLVFKTKPPVPVALDESLSQLDPQDLSAPYNISAVIIKPTMLGLELASRFARAATDNGVKAVISSAFESSLGIHTLASLAAAFGGNTAAGLDTLSWLEDDICDQPITITNGHIDLERTDPTPASVRVSRLEEIA